MKYCFSASTFGSSDAQTVMTTKQDLDIKASCSDEDFPEEYRDDLSYQIERLLGQRIVLSEECTHFSSSPSKSSSAIDPVHNRETKIKSCSNPSHSLCISSRTTKVSPPTVALSSNDLTSSQRKSCHDSYSGDICKLKDYSSHVNEEQDLKLKKCNEIEKTFSSPVNSTDSRFQQESKQSQIYPIGYKNISPHLALGKQFSVVGEPKDDDYYSFVMSERSMHASINLEQNYERCSNREHRSGTSTYSPVSPKTMLYQSTVVQRNMKEYPTYPSHSNVLGASSKNILDTSNKELNDTNSGSISESAFTFAKGFVQSNKQAHKHWQTSHEGTDLSLTDQSLLIDSDYDSRPSENLAVIDVETSPTSVSSVASCKPLEWDNVADIGYANVIRGDPEGFSLLHKNAASVKSKKKEQSFHDVSVNMYKTKKKEVTTTEFDRYHNNCPLPLSHHFPVMDEAESFSYDHNVTSDKSRHSCQQKVEVNNEQTSDSSFVKDSVLQVKIPSICTASESTSSKDTIQFQKAHEKSEQVPTDFKQVLFHPPSTITSQPTGPVCHPSDETNRYLRLHPIDSLDLSGRSSGINVCRSMQDNTILNQNGSQNSNSVDSGALESSNQESLNKREDSESLSVQCGLKPNILTGAQGFIPSLVLFDPITSNNTLTINSDYSLPSGKLIFVENATLQHLLSGHHEDSGHIQLYPVSENYDDFQDIRDVATQTAMSYLTEHPPQFLQSSAGNEFHENLELKNMSKPLGSHCNEECPHCQELFLKSTSDNIKLKTVYEPSKLRESQLEEVLPFSQSEPSQSICNPEFESSYGNHQMKIPDSDCQEDKLNMFGQPSCKTRVFENAVPNADNYINQSLYITKELDELNLPHDAKHFSEHSHATEISDSILESSSGFRDLTDELQNIPNERLICSDVKLIGSHSYDEPDQENPTVILGFPLKETNDESGKLQSFEKNRPSSSLLAEFGNTDVSLTSNTNFAEIRQKKYFSHAFKQDNKKSAAANRFQEAEKDCFNIQSALRGSGLNETSHELKVLQQIITNQQKNYEKQMQREIERIQHLRDIIRQYDLVTDQDKNTQVVLEHSESSDAEKGMFDGDFTSQSDLSKTCVEYISSLSDCSRNTSSEYVCRGHKDGAIKNVHVPCHPFLRKDDELVSKREGKVKTRNMERKKCSNRSSAVNTKTVSVQTDSNMNLQRTYSTRVREAKFIVLNTFTQPNSEGRKDLKFNYASSISRENLKPKTCSQSQTWLIEQGVNQELISSARTGSVSLQEAFMKHCLRTVARVNARQQLIAQLAETRRFHYTPCGNEVQRTVAKSITPSNSAANDSCVSLGTNNFLSEASEAAEERRKYCFKKLRHLTARRAQEYYMKDDKPYLQETYAGYRFRRKLFSKKLSENVLKGKCSWRLSETVLC